MKRLACFAAVALAVSACSPSGYLSGTIDGESIFVQDAVYVPMRDSRSGVVLAGMLMMSDQPELCRSVRGGHLPKKSEVLVLGTVRLTTGGYAPPVEGDYSVLNATTTQSFGNFIIGAAVRYDSSCTPRRAETHSLLSSGEVTIESLDLGRDGITEGSLDVDVGVQHDRLTGRFHAETCEADLTTFSPGCG
jgi:hypothetical protein